MAQAADVLSEIGKVDSDFTLLDSMVPEFPSTHSTVGSGAWCSLVSWEVEEQWASTSTAWDLFPHTFYSVFTSVYAMGLLEINFVELAETVEEVHPQHSLQDYTEISFLYACPKFLILF